MRHIERCRAIVHVIDCATYEPGRDPVSDLDVIEGELIAHGGLRIVRAWWCSTRLTFLMPLI
ncbi:GTP-binding protein Obg [Cutibacterium acnes JCM 18918]|nr:GTP-binding protein Obg [Cutibacterium acnes JCM 18918]